jgi:hypothetical protein
MLKDCIKYIRLLGYIKDFMRVEDYSRKEYVNPKFPNLINFHSKCCLTQVFTDKEKC